MSTVTLASGLTLSYAEQGDASRPAVLLLPGPTDSWRSYQSVLDLLPREIRAVSVSQPGHGESDKPDWGYAVADFASERGFAARCPRDRTRGPYGPLGLVSRCPEGCARSSGSRRRIDPRSVSDNAS